MQTKKFRFGDRLKSFTYAWNGIKFVIKNEQNARVHLVGMALALIFGFIFDINSTEWIILIFAVGFVFVSELFNTAIEVTADFVESKQDDRIAVIKDCGAGGVLISAIVACIAGLIIFVPKIVDTFNF